MSMRNGREDGASAVEFALVFPLLAMLLFGMITAGWALNQQQQINHAAREGARFGATLPGFVACDASDPTNTCVADTFDLVANRVVNTAVGQLNPVAGTAHICVAYFAEDSDDAKVLWYDGANPNSASTATPAGRTCDDRLPGAEPRIQVLVFLPFRIEAVFFRSPTGATMTADAVSIYEPRTQP